MFAYLILGAMKEILYKVVRREAEYSEQEVVDGIYDFSGHGCFRIHGASKKKRGKPVPLKARRRTLGRM